MISQRDSFISRLFEIAVNDKDIYLLSVDMGAPTLDQWRSELPDQFLAAGISEQNAINFAAGLSAAGKKVFVYFMASWAARCFEQIRYSCAMAGNPITILGNGVGLGYAPAGPAHEPNEDIAYMRSLCGIEIYSPTNSAMASSLADLCCEEPKLRYIRLERKYDAALDNLYSDFGISKFLLKNGLSVAVPGLAEPPHDNSKKICIISSGFMLGRSIQVANKFRSQGYQVSVVDLWRIKPINTSLLCRSIEKHNLIVTIEEQTLSGGFGSAICEVMCDFGIKKDVLRIGLPERYIFENATRDYLIDNNGLSVDSICNKIEIVL